MVQQYHLQHIQLFQLHHSIITKIFGLYLQEHQQLLLVVDLFIQTMDILILVVILLVVVI